MTDVAMTDAIALNLPDLAATERLAAALAAAAKPGDFIALEGPLGAGKTALARAFIAARATARGKAEETVPSPTFTLVQVYDFGGDEIWHFDLFRLRGWEETDELGFDEAVHGVALVEWPDRLGPLLPKDRLVVSLDYGAGDGGRTARIDGLGAWAARMTGLHKALAGAGLR